MNTHADPTKQSRDHAVTSSFAKQQCRSKPTLQLPDRPEMIAEGRFQKAINNSRRVRQLQAYREMANNGPQAKQFRVYQAMADNYTAKTAQRKENLQGKERQGQLGYLQKKDASRLKIHENNVRPIQLYTEAGGEKRSDNDQYVVFDDDSTKLYVAAGGDAPHPGRLIIPTGNSRDIAGFNYTAYHYDPGLNFVNDCLSFAEGIIQGTGGASGRAELRANGDRPNGQDRLFGQSDQQNKSIAEGAWSMGQNADPGIGEAYGITRTRLPAIGETPYHIAAVVAKDGVDNVTLEADADNEGQAAPVFDIYDTTPAGRRVNAESLTFEETYTTSYSPSATGVLRQR
jgi:hypothetical protein